MKDASLRPRYAYVDKLPDRLFDAVICNPHGELRPRSDAILVLRDALLSGELPPRESLAWPMGPIRDGMFDVLARSGLALYCRNDPDMSDAVLLDLLHATEDAQRRADELAAEWVLQARAQREQVVWVGLTPGSDQGVRGQTLLDESQWQKMRDEAIALAAKVCAEQLLDKAEQHKHDAADQREVRRLLEELAGSVGAGTRAAGGMMQMLDPSQFATLRQLFANHGPYVKLLRSLGRLAPSEDEAPADQESPEGPIEREGSKDALESSPGVADIRGVERSAEIARMLGSEAALRAHAATRKLWFARFAERSLLTYFAESSVPRTTPSLQHFAPGRQRTNPRAELGPIIIILDTSGSMRGASEIVAKAAAMQALALAHMQQRPCYLYNFAGTGELAQEELTLDQEGLARTLALLSMSFWGGTLIDEALRCACRQIDTEQWRSADMLVLTDGGICDLDRATLSTLEDARKRLNFQIHTGLTRSRAVDIRRGRSHDCDYFVVQSFSDHVHGLLDAIERYKD